MAVRHVHSLVTTYPRYAIMSNGTIILMGEGGVGDHPSPLPYTIPMAGVASTIDTMINDLQRDHPHVYSTLATWGFPFKGVTGRSTIEVSNKLYMVEWRGGQVVHLVAAATETDAEAQAIQAYTNDYLRPNVITSGVLKK